MGHQPDISLTYFSSICRCSESGKKRKTGREKFFNVWYVQSSNIFRKKRKNSL